MYLDEIVVKGEGKPGTREEKVAQWITTHYTQHRERAAQLSSPLGRKEREAIVLAQERQEKLLIDDVTARKKAEARNVNVLAPCGSYKRQKRNALYPKFLAMVGEREEEQ